MGETMAAKKAAKKTVPRGTKGGFKGRNVPVVEGGQHVQDQRQEDVLSANDGTAQEEGGEEQD